MKKLLLVLLCATLLAGCSFNKSDDSGTDDGAVTTTIGIVNNEEIEKAEGNVIYDYDGFSVSLGKYNGNDLHFLVKNDSSQTRSLDSLYISADGMVFSAMYITTDNIAPGGSEDVKLSELDGVGILRTRFYLSDEDYNKIPESVSEPIEISVNDDYWLQSKRLGYTVYENDKLRLSVFEIKYGSTGNSVRVRLLAENKTDRDLYLQTSDVECVPEDFYGSAYDFIPANANALVPLSVRPFSEGYTSADLKQVSFKIVSVPVDDYLQQIDTAAESTDQITVIVPESEESE